MLGTSKWNAAALSVVVDRSKYKIITFCGDSSDEEILASINRGLNLPVDHRNFVFLFDYISSFNKYCNTFTGRGKVVIHDTEENLIGIGLQPVDVYKLPNLNIWKCNNLTNEKFGELLDASDDIIFPVSTEIEELETDDTASDILESDDVLEVDDDEIFNLDFDKIEPIKFEETIPEFSDDLMGDIDSLLYGCALVNTRLLLRTKIVEYMCGLISIRDIKEAIRSIPDEHQQSVWEFCSSERVVNNYHAYHLYCMNDDLDLAIRVSGALKDDVEQLLAIHPKQQYQFAIPLPKTVLKAHSKAQEDMVANAKPQLRPLFGFHKAS